MERVQGYQRDQAITIASGATASSAINLRGYAQAGYLIPSAFSGATVTFQVSAENTTYQVLHDSTNTVITQTVTASKAYALPISCFAFGYVKLISASAEGADRTIIVSLKY